MERLHTGVPCYARSVTVLGWKRCQQLLLLFDDDKDGRRQTNQFEDAPGSCWIFTRWLQNGRQNPEKKERQTPLTDNISMFKM